MPQERLAAPVPVGCEFVDSSVPGCERPCFTGRYVGSVGRNVGGLRTFVACSNAKARLTSFGSEKARPMKVIPTGSPKLKPAGTVTSGKPARAAGPVLASSK